MKEINPESSRDPNKFILPKSEILDASKYFDGHDEVWSRLNGSNIDDYDFLDDLDPLNELIQDPPVEYGDEDDPFFRHDGIFIDSIITLKLMNILAGKYGLFQRQGHVTAGDHGYPHVKAEEVKRSLSESESRVVEVLSMLKPLLIEQGVAEEDIPAKVDKIIESFRGKYSGSQEKRATLAGDRKYHLDSANEALMGRKAVQLSRE